MKKYAAVLFVIALFAVGCAQQEPAAVQEKPAPAEAPAMAEPVPAPVPESVKQEPAVKLITGFEGEKNWTARFGTAEAGTDARGLTQGSKVLVVKFEKSDRWPAITIELDAEAGDWSEYAQFKADIFNSSDKEVWLGLAAADAAGAASGSQGLGGNSMTLKPGKNTYVFALNPTRAKDGHFLDFSRMKSIQFFQDRPKEAVALLIDNIRLEGKAAAPAGTAAGLKAFDFGPVKSPAWAGFELVTPETVYSPELAYGWAEKVISGASNSTKPDGLAGDQVGFSMAQVREPGGNEFRIDLKPGKYLTAMIVRNPVPVRTWGVAAENAALFETEINVNNTLEYVCRNSGIDYPPGTDVFTVFVEREYPVRQHMIEVKDGQLNLEFKACGVHMLALAPIAKKEEFAAWLKEVRDARRKEFHASHFAEAPMPAVKALADIRPADKASGLVVYTRDYGEEIYTNDVPDAAARGREAVLTAAQGEQEPLSIAVHALEDLKDVTLTVSSLKSESGQAIESRDVDIRVMRFFPKINTFRRSQTRMVPMHLWPANKVDIPKGTTRQFWVTFTAPADLQSAAVFKGTVSVAAPGKPAASLPVQLRVQAFALPSPEEVPAAFAWFYVGPEWRHENWRLGWFDGPEAEKEKRRILKAELADMQAHGSNCVQLPAPEYIDYVDGRIKLDFTDLDRYASVMHELNFGLKHDNQLFMLRIAGRLIQRAKLKEFSPEFKAAYLDAMRQVKAWSEAKKIPLMYWLVDEPREKKPNAWNRNFDKTIAYLKLAREVKGVRTTISMMGDVQNGKDYKGMLEHMDILQTHPAAKSRGLQAAALERGEPILKFFNAGKNLTRYPFGFHLWHRRAQGIFQWHYHYWTDPGNPLQPITGYNWGVSNVVFLTPGGPVPTLWHELVREGVDDYRYLALLEQKIASAGDLPAAAKARARLEEIRASFPEVIPEKLCVGDDGLAYQDPILKRLPALREEVAAMINSLNKE